jgi:hypothetical protein
MQENLDPSAATAAGGQQNLTLLNDSPAGTDGPKSVMFNHAIYAEVLSKILASNRSGICVGFFARWGQGKSTVINLLQRALPSDMMVVTFNAYHARGDSVRRQMLLTVLRQVNPKKAEEYEHFSQTATGLEFATVEEKARFSTRGLIKLLMTEKKFDPILVGAAVAALLFTGVLAIRGFHLLFSDAKVSEVKDLFAWVWASLVACIAFIAKKLASRRDKILAYTHSPFLIASV